MLQKTLSPEMRAWRYRVFASTWLCYAGYYFCRKPFYNAKSALIEAHGWSSQLLGNVGAIYLITYAVGQFLAGQAGNRFGPRKVLLVGMLVTIAVNVVFGITDSAATFAVFMGLNGLFQATGWSSCVATVGRWFGRHERAAVMGPWATNFQIGSIAAGFFSSWLLGHYGYQWSFFGGSLVLLAIWTFFVFNQRDRPEDVGLPPIEDDEPHLPGADPSVADKMPLPVIFNIGLIGTFYFFAKLIRYAFWSWVPLLLTMHFGLTKQNSGYMTNIFDIAGFIGTSAAGLLAERVFKGSLARLSFFFILAMTVSMGLLYLGGTANLTVFGISLFLVGFFLFGPDALMTGAGAVAVGSPRHAARAAGTISAIGSLGPILQELVLPRYMKGDDVSTVFGLLLGSAVLCLLTLGWMLRRNARGMASV